MVQSLETLLMTLGLLHWKGEFYSINTPILRSFYGKISYPENIYDHNL